MSPTSSLYDSLVQSRNYMYLSTNRYFHFHNKIIPPPPFIYLFGNTQYSRTVNFIIKLYSP